MPMQYNHANTDCYQCRMDGYRLIHNDIVPKNYKWSVLYDSIVVNTLTSYAILKMEKTLRIKIIRPSPGYSPGLLTLADAPPQPDPVRLDNALIWAIR